MGGRLFLKRIEDVKERTETKSGVLITLTTISHDAYFLSYIALSKGAVIYKIALHSDNDMKKALDYVVQCYAIVPKRERVMGSKVVAVPRFARCFLGYCARVFNVGFGRTLVSLNTYRPGYHEISFLR